MAHKAPGKSERKGMTIIELMDMFPTEEAATKWFEAQVWGGHRACGHCGSLNTQEATHKTMPYWCTDCRSYFSVRTGTAIARSNIPLRKWAIAIYLVTTSLKSISSMKLHRDIGVSQKSAWFMLHRLREAWAQESGTPYDGPVEVDETHVGGRRRNMSNEKRRELKAQGMGSGYDSMTAVVGAKDRASNQVSAQVIERKDKRTLHGFVSEHAAEDATVYTDEWKGYKNLPFEHETVNHSVAEYVRGQAHTNGIESFWAMLKRAHKGTFHKMSPKHLQRYVSEFAAKHNLRELDTADLMGALVSGMVGRNLLYRDLVADNGLDSGARS